MSSKLMSWRDAQLVSFKFPSIKMSHWGIWNTPVITLVLEAMMI